jgi:tetratricopeptide (TPR) repeat protein
VATADQLVLKGGGTLSGVLVKQTPEAVTIDVALGRVTLPASRVERIVSGDSTLGEYRSRALGLRQDDAAGWLALGFWAQDAGLHAQAREAFRRVLAYDPDNAVAQQALGNVRLGERWVSPEESYRAQGLVYYDGSWMTREERDFAAREREVAARTEAAERARTEAEARARDAEARAEAAEAEARRAAYEDPGYPLDWVYGAYGGVGYGGVGCCNGGFFPSKFPRRHHLGAGRPVRPSASPPPTQARGSQSGGGSSRAKAASR